MHADLVSISTNILYIFLPAPSAFFPFTFRSQMASSHSHLFPFQLPLLSLSLLRQYSHFNVNTDYVYLSLNPPPSFCTAFPEIPEKTHKRNMGMFMRPATQYVLRYPVKGNTFFFMGCTNFLFSTVCASYIPIWYYIYDA